MYFFGQGGSIGTHVTWCRAKITPGAMLKGMIATRLRCLPCSHSPILTALAGAIVAPVADRDLEFAFHRADRDFDDGRGRDGQGVAQGFFQSPGVCGEYAARAEGASQGDEVGVVQTGTEDPAAELALLGAEDIAIGTVVEDDGYGVDAVLDSGGQFLGVVEEATVAAERDDRALGCGDLGAEGDGEGAAEGYMGGGG